MELHAGGVAVVTGAALGIGLGTARHCAAAGLSVVLVDLPSAELDAAADAVRAVAAGGTVVSHGVSVADRAAMLAMAGEVIDTLGAPQLLVNNAVTRAGGKLLEDTGDWHDAFEVNFWGVVNGVDAFAASMRGAGQAAAIVNVGSKQGITNPPGKAIYNIAKSAVKSYTELLAHELRSAGDRHVTAHLLVPGFTATGRQPSTDPGAWTPAQVVERMFDQVRRGSFYIVCPDNEVSAAMDRKRILWAAMDITEDRPALSRWAGTHDEAFARFEPPPRE